MEITGVCMKSSFVGVAILAAFICNSAMAQPEQHSFYTGIGFGTVKVKALDELKFSDARNGAIQFGYKISENFAIEAQYSTSIKDAKAKDAIQTVDFSEAWWKEVIRLNPTMSLFEAQNLFPYAVADLTVNLNAKIDTTALYGVYRSSGNLYFKIKAGYLREEVKLTGRGQEADVYVAVQNGQPIEVNDTKGSQTFSTFGFDKKITISETDSGFSGGLGAGYKFTEQLFAELEYTRIEADVNFLSASLNYAF
ncbi:MAG: porin family protein [Moraxellaceae bacterium]|nr:MAG: porin family protein [Moraxellaceae bacterium]